MRRLLLKLKCKLGFHKWKNIETTEMPPVPEGGYLIWRELHECEACKKQEWFGDIVY
jgi:hypothetical protein